jgi:hypothetical protein
MNGCTRIVAYPYDAHVHVAGQGVNPPSERVAIRASSGRYLIVRDESSGQKRAANYGGGD